MLLIMRALFIEPLNDFRNPGAIFKSFYHTYYFEKGNLKKFIEKMGFLIDAPADGINYPLLPLSKGCKISLQGEILKI